MTGLSDAKILLLAAELLDLAHEEFSGHCCNDWATMLLTRSELVELTRRFQQDNSDGEDFDPDQPIACDWIAMIATAHELKRMAKKVRV